MTKNMSFTNCNCTWESDKILKMCKNSRFNNNNKSKYCAGENYILINKKWQDGISHYV